MQFYQHWWDNFAKKAHILHLESKNAAESYNLFWKKIVSSKKSCRHAECKVANADESFSSSWRWGTHGVQQCWIVLIFLSKRRFSENVSPDTQFQVSTNLPFFFSQSDKRFRSKSVMLESISFYCTFFKMLLWTHKMLLWWSRRKNFDKRKQNRPSNSKNYKTNYYFRKTIFLFQIALRTRKTQSCQAWWEIFAETKIKVLSNSEMFEKNTFSNMFFWKCSFEDIEWSLDKPAGEVLPRSCNFFSLSLETSRFFTRSPKTLEK